MKFRTTTTAFLSSLLFSSFGLAWIVPDARLVHIGKPSSRPEIKSTHCFQREWCCTSSSRSATIAPLFSSFPGSTTAATIATAAQLPRLTAEHLQQLQEKQYVVIPNFLPHPLQDELRTDVYRLRNAGAQHPPATAAAAAHSPTATTTATTKSYFQVARIGQDSTNQLNTDIRVAETCFLGPGKLSDVPSAARETLYQVLDQVRLDLQDGPSSSSSAAASAPRTPLDASLTELLYAYYPEGGFYRLHRDAVPGSASTLRRYSLLLYLNDRDNNWDLARDGGALRLHLGPYLDIDCWDDDAAVMGQYEDVVPAGGTLVLFASDAIPHEVLDTNRERLAVVGWYNRPLRGWTDVAELTTAGDSHVSPIRLAMMAVALALVTVGVLGLVQ